MCEYCKGEYGNDCIDGYNAEWLISKYSDRWELEVEIESRDSLGYDYTTSFIDIEFCPKCGRNLNEEVMENE